MLSWDGSYLDTIAQTEMTDEVKVGKVVYCKYKDYNIAYSCSNDLYPCVIDEVAPIFGIRKCGTHGFTFGRGIKVMYNVGEDINTLEGLNIKIQTDEVRMKIQNIIVYRAIMGIKSSPNKFIITKNNDYTFFNNVIDLDHSLDILSQDKWIMEINIQKCVIRMLKIKRRSNRDVAMVKVSEAIEDVFSRIDRELYDIYFERIYQIIGDSLA